MSKETFAHEVDCSIGVNSRHGCDCLVSEIEKLQAANKILSEAVDFYIDLDWSYCSESCDTENGSFARQAKQKSEEVNK